MEYKYPNFKGKKQPWIIFLTKIIPQFQLNIAN